MYTFQRDGFYRVGCDIHPAMAASCSRRPLITALAATDGSSSFAMSLPRLGMVYGLQRVAGAAQGRRGHERRDLAS